MVKRPALAALATALVLAVPASTAIAACAKQHLLGTWRMFTTHTGASDSRYIQCHLRFVRDALSRPVIDVDRSACIDHQDRALPLTDTGEWSLTNRNRCRWTGRIDSIETSGSLRLEFTLYRKRRIFLGAHRTYRGNRLISSGLVQAMKVR